MSEWAGKAIASMAVAFATWAGLYYTQELGAIWGLATLFWIWNRPTRERED